MESVAAVVGDLVGSRLAQNRRDLHDRFAAAVDRINSAEGRQRPVTQLRIMAGDDYQGCFASVGVALQATLRLRLALGAEADIRHGIGWGPVSVLSEEPRVEDGPGWWAARAAIEEVEAAQAKPGFRALRTAYRRAADAAGPDPDAVNAALVARDQLLAGAGPESLSVLAGMLAGMSQKQIAADLGISPSAVSQRVRRDGLAALIHVDDLLGAVT